MAFTHHFKPAHKEIKAYYETLASYAGHQVAHEGATSTAFQTLLAATCKKADWHLVPQLATKIRGKQVRPDGKEERIRQTGGVYIQDRMTNQLIDFSNSPQKAFRLP